jgi:nicotinate-nucleotide adenylyltransferase
VRLGIFGGSFDPPHIGHLLAASDAFELLELDRLLFIPAAVQPFKRNELQGSAAQRLRMVELMIAGDARFAADPVEIDRKGLSFTVETLEVLAERYPGGTAFPAHRRGSGWRVRDLARCRAYRRARGSRRPGASVERER